MSNNTPINIVSDRLFQAQALADTLRKANEDGGEVELVAQVLQRLITEALDALEKSEAAHA